MPPKNLLSDSIGFYDFEKIFIDSSWQKTTGNGSDDITKFLLEAGNGARVEITLNSNNFSHLFVAENDNGKVRFIDPQTGDIDVRRYFDKALPNTTRFARIDNCKVSNLIKECLEVAI